MCTEDAAARAQRAVVAAEALDMALRAVRRRWEGAEITVLRDEVARLETSVSALEALLKAQADVLRAARDRLTAVADADHAA